MRSETNQLARRIWNERAFRKTVRLRLEKGTKVLLLSRHLALAFGDWREIDDEIQ
jgi:hypothetical protein